MPERGAGQTLSAILCALMLLTVMQLASSNASALITESFEAGFGDWVPDYNNVPGFFDITISSLYSYDGSYSAKLWSHGLPLPDRNTVWIERTVQGPANTWLTVGLAFQLYNEDSTADMQEVVAYVGNNDPEDYPDFTTVGVVDQIGSWMEYSHSDSFMSGPTGQVYVALGCFNAWHPAAPGRSCYVDMVNITGISNDFDPPTISNLQPLNQTTISENQPLIGASYSDPSGIDVNSVLLRVDGMDRTAQATVTASDVSYTHAVPMSEGIHNVYLEVQDDTPNNNKAVATWWFLVDTWPPVISNRQPVNESFIGDTTPTIGATYADDSGIDTATVLLIVDGVDMTAMATVTATDVSYVPAVPLADDFYVVRLDVSDLSNPQNTAVEVWWFNVDTQPPTIANLQPANQSYIGNTMPVIGASYSDISGIDTSSVKLWVDAFDVTASATVTTSDVSYTPAVPLADGPHNVLLQVGDNSQPQNIGFASWTFTVDTQSPQITNQQPSPLSTVSDATPTIGADYSDTSGIDIGSVFMQVNGLDVTPSATVQPSGITYLPGFPLWDGVHNVYLEVRDNTDPQNLATASWSFTVDTTLPSVFNLQPANVSIIGDSTPDIGAMYSDDSEIDLGTVMLEVDGGDVTAQATVGPNMVTYTPSAALSDGPHDVRLEVGDTAAPANLAVEFWSFVVDTEPPSFGTLQPENESMIGVTTPTIGASYFDESGVDLASVILRLDGSDVTHLTTVTVSDVTYAHSIPLEDGIHDIYLSVADHSNPQNVAVVTWWFQVLTWPPVISDLQPADQELLGDTTPTISASYNDDIGIDVNSVELRVDTVDVTAQATVTQSGVLYVPSVPLSDGQHDVFLSVADVDGRVATESWSFTIDATPPTTTIEILGPNYTDGQDWEYVSSQTSFRLTAWDSTGVEDTWYLYYEIGEAEPGYSLYTSEFSISSSKSDGIVYIKYKSTDDFFNEEAPQTLEVRLDNTPPVTSVSIGTPSYVDDATYIRSSTEITFSADDSGSGAGSTSYKVMRGGATEVNWTSYVTGPLFLLGDDGERQIHVKSVDVLGTEESDVIQIVHLDNSPPVSSLVVGTPSHQDSGITYITSTTQISFSADDAASGSAMTQYAVFKGGSPEVVWTDFIGGWITLSGDDGQREIKVKSTDNLGNLETEVIEAVYLDQTPPTSSAPGFTVNVTYISNSLATVTVSATDSASGVSSIAYGVDDPNCPNTYAGALVVGTMGEGQHDVYFRGTDNVGNEEAIQFIALFLDTTAPTANAGPNSEIKKGDTLIFDGSLSSDGATGSGIVSYSWTFTYRGSEVTLDGATPQYIFEVRGAFIITLTVTDRAGNTDMDTMTITFASQEVSSEFPWWVMVLLAIVIILLLAVLLLRRRRDEEPEETEE